MRPDTPFGSFCPNQGIKLRCNQMIHVRQLPFKPDTTYFRGDRTRPVEIVKVDVVERGRARSREGHGESPTSGRSTRHFSIGDAGMDAADVYAHGPGRLETRPDRDQPVERIAIWQDTLIVKNKLGPKNEVLHKVIDLSGNRPCFIDNLQKTSIDSASWIQVWLKPKPAVPPEPGSGSTALAGHAVSGQHGDVPTTIASVDQTESLILRWPIERQQRERFEGGNGRRQPPDGAIARARRCSFAAPAKTMTARERLDAEFIEAEATQVASATRRETRRRSPAYHWRLHSRGHGRTGAGQGTRSGAGRRSRSSRKASDDPPMTGSCDRMWARVALKPKSESDKTVEQADRAGTKTASTKPGAGETNAEIRKVWMWGNVALHQDPKKEKDKSQDNSDKKGGTDASGEALYLDNRGTNKAITYVYQRDPTEKNPFAGPACPPASRVSKGMISRTSRPPAVSR